jgi:hypothetical protein
MVHSKYLLNLLIKFLKLPPNCINLRVLSFSMTSRFSDDVHRLIQCSDFTVLSNVTAVLRNCMLHLEENEKLGGILLPCSVRKWKCGDMMDGNFFRSR